MSRKSSDVVIVKIGGATLGSHDTTLEDIVSLQKQGRQVVVVHGGGKIITEWLGKQEAGTEFIKGERVTDEKTLEVVVSVLAGLVNKGLVASLNNLGGKAVGISGIDGALVQGRIKDSKLGYVGEVTKVDTSLLRQLLESGYVPVVAPVSLLVSGKPDKTAGMLNINADAVAGEIAAAMKAEKLIFLTDVAGVCDNNGKLLSELSPGEIESLISSGVISGGMIPKIMACLKALFGTPVARVIDGRQAHALLKEMEGRGDGTTIKAEVVK